MMRQHGYSCHIAALSPKSRGTVGLASADPSHPPVIDFKLLSHPDDVKTLVEGVRLVRKILRLRPSRSTAKRSSTLALTHRATRRSAKLSVIGAASRSMPPEPAGWVTTIWRW